MKLFTILPIVCVIFLISTTTRTTFAAAASGSGSGSASASGSVSFDASNSLLGDILKGFEGLGSTIIDGIKNVTKRGLEDARNFGASINNLTIAILREAERNGRAIIGDTERNVANFGAEIESFKLNLILQLEGLRNTIKRRVLTDIQNVLVEIDDDIKELQENLGRIRTRWNEDIAKESQKLTQQFNIWAASQLEKVGVATNGSEEAINKADQLINGFVNRYTNQLKRAADEAEGDINNFEQRVQKIIGDYRPLIQQLIGSVQECFTSNDGLIASLSCERKARRELSKLSNILIDFKRLAEEALQLLNARFRNRSTVVQILAEYVLERFSVELRIDGIIKANGSANGNASGGSSGGDSGSGSGSVSGNANGGGSGSDSGSGSGSGNDSGSGSGDASGGSSDNGEGNVSGGDNSNGDGSDSDSDSENAAGK